MNRRALHQIIRYGVTGVVSVATYVGSLWALVHVISLPEIVANTAAYSLATLLNYLLNFYWSFVSSETHSAASAKFLTVVAVGFALNAAFVALATSAGMPVAWAAFLFAALWPLASFALQKIWVFKS